jgi:hypothetical protein
MRGMRERRRRMRREKHMSSERAQERLSQNARKKDWYVGRRHGRCAAPTPFPPPPQTRTNVRLAQ